MRRDPLRLSFWRGCFFYGTILAQSAGLVWATVVLVDHFR